MVKNISELVISILLLVSLVGFSFAYVSSNREILVRPSQPWLGIIATAVTPDIAQAMGLRDIKGLLVVQTVPDSPAEKYGIKGGDKPSSVGGRDVLLGGDVILNIYDQPVDNIDAMRSQLDGKQVGDNVKFSVFRDGEIRTINVVLEARPSPS